MEKKKQTLVMATVVATAIVFGTMVMAVNHNNLTNVFATLSENEYGCAANCTGEYYVRHINELLKTNEQLSGTENVRVIATVSRLKGYYQDITYTTPIKEINQAVINNNLVIKVAPGQSFGFDSTNFKEGDTVAFFGTVKLQYLQYKSFKDYVVTITNPTYYRWNDQSNLKLLEPVVYLN